MCAGLMAAIIAVLELPPVKKGAFQLVINCITEMYGPPYRTAHVKLEPQI